MLRRYPFVCIFLLTVLCICSAFYFRFPVDLRADTEADYLDSMRVYRVQVTEPPVVRLSGCLVPVRLLAYGQQAMLHLYADSLAGAPVVGDIMLVHTRITRPERVFPDEFDYGNYLRLRHKAGIGYVPAGHWQRIGHAPVRTLRAYAVSVRQRLVQRYRDAGLSGRPLAFLSAITLGERDALDSGLRQSFAAAGAAHVLAVSGLHTGIICLAVVSLLTCFGRFRPLYEQRLRRVLLSLTIILSMWVYAFVTGLSPSVMRAVVVLTIVQVGWMLRRQALSFNTLAAAACICLWAEPLSLFNVSFQLSFSAVLGILMFVPYMNGVWKVKGSGMVRWLRDLITMSLAATIGTMPVTLYYFGQVSHYFLLTNLVVLPAAFAMVILGAVVLLLAHTALGGWLAVGLKYLSTWVCAYVSRIEHLPYATLHMSATLWMAFCLAAAVLLCYVSLRRRRPVWLAPAAAAVALFCTLHVYNVRQTAACQQLAIRNRTVYYRRAATVRQYTLDSRYTFFRYNGQDYLYAPYQPEYIRQALQQFCTGRGITYSPEEYVCYN